MTEETQRAKTRYAIIGTGSRAQLYLGAIAGPHSGVAEIVAWTDSNEGRLDYAESRLLALSPEATLPARSTPDELSSLLAANRVDRVIVTSPDFTHARYVIAALESGADVVVEKPLTIDAESSRAIAQAVERTGREVVVTFNYRYSPRNSALRSVIASGEIGAVTSVHFEWVLDTAHGADYFRRWHRLKANSGGLLIHKASHHFDLVNWWIDDTPRRVFASGGLRFYGPENAAERGLGARPARGSADEPGQDAFSLDLRTDERLRALYFDNEEHDGYLRDRDVFTGEITIEDNLSLVVDYESGASMSYSLNAHSPWEGYTVAVNGTLGRAELTVVERGAVLVAAGGVPVDPSAHPDAVVAEQTRPVGERLVVQRHFEPARTVEIPEAEGGHGGGDDILLRDVFLGRQPDPLGRAADYLDGVRAIAVGIAGNCSLATGQAVTVESLGLGVDLSHARADRRDVPGEPA
jgi:predicted dehydrogenase